MKGLHTRSGCEAESNDGNVRYIVHKVTNFPREGMEQSVYASNVFVRMQGNSWQQSVDSGRVYSSIDEFIQSISRTPEMSQAYKELAK